MRRFMYSPGNESGGGNPSPVTASAGSEPAAPAQSSAPASGNGQVTDRAAGVKKIAEMRAKLTGTAAPQEPAAPKPPSQKPPAAPPAEDDAEVTERDPGDETDEYPDDSPNDVSHLDPKLVQRARALGFSDEEIAGYDTNKGLGNTIRMGEKYGQQPAEQPQQRREEPAPKADAKPTAAQRERWKLKGKPEEYHPAFLEELKGLDEYYHAQFSALEQRYEADRTAAATEREQAKVLQRAQGIKNAFVSFVEKNKAFENFFWKGEPDSAGTLGKSRVAETIKEISILEAGYQSRGMAVPPMDVLVKKAVMSLYGGRAKRFAANEIIQQQNGRAAGAVDLPRSLNGNSNGNGKPPERTREAGLAFIRNKRREMGIA